MFLGLVGTGKTHLAVGILRAVIHGSHTGKYVTVSRIMRERQGQFMTTEDAGWGIVN